MNLRINVPDNLKDLLEEKAAESGLDVEAFVVESIRERLGQSEAAKFSPANDFESWLACTRRIVPDLTGPVDDSRESIYAGRDE